MKIPHLITLPLRRHLWDEEFANVKRFYQDCRFWYNYTHFFPTQCNLFEFIVKNSNTELDCAFVLFSGNLISLSGFARGRARMACRFPDFIVPQFMATAAARQGLPLQVSSFSMNEAKPIPSDAHRRTDHVRMIQFRK